MCNTTSSVWARLRFWLHFLSQLQRSRMLCESTFGQVDPGRRAKVYTGMVKSFPRWKGLKTWKFNICYPAKTLVCLSWILFGRPFDRDWLTMQPLFCYIFKRSSACDWLFLLTTLYSLSWPWKRAKCSPRHSKISKIFPGTPLRVCIFTAQTHPPPPHTHTHTRKILAARLKWYFSIKLCRIAKQRTH